MQMEYPFYTITNLQGSQTQIWMFFVSQCFTPLQTYKVLKHICQANSITFRFTPLQTYKVLKQKMPYRRLISCFTPLQTYKVLKRCTTQRSIDAGFTPLQTYKVLKPQMRLSPSQTYWLICVSYLVMYKTHVFIY